MLCIIKKSRLVRQIFYVISILSLTACGFYRLQENDKGLLVVNEKAKYTFNKKPDSNALKNIDTTAIYIQVFEGRFYNENEKNYRSIYKFHNDGYYQWNFIRSGEILSFDNSDKKTISYGGKYRLDGNKIEFQHFYPSKGGYTKYYSRNITKAEIIDEKIIIYRNNKYVSTVLKRQ